MYDENDPAQQAPTAQPEPFTADGRRQTGQGGIDLGAILAVNDTIQGAETAPGGLELSELNRQYPVDQLCGPASMQTLREGLVGGRWMTLLLNSPLQDGGWEVWLGGYITECAKAGEWRITGESSGDMEKPIRMGMFQEIDTPAGPRCVPTEWLCQFVKEKLAIYTK